MTRLFNTRYVVNNIDKLVQMCFGKEHKFMNKDHVAICMQLFVQSLTVFEPHHETAFLCHMPANPLSLIS